GACGDGDRHGGGTGDRVGAKLLAQAPNRATAFRQGDGRRPKGCSARRRLLGSVSLATAIDHCALPWIRRAPSTSTRQIKSRISGRLAASPVNRLVWNVGIEVAVGPRI